MTGAAVCRTGTLRAGLAGGRRRVASGVRRRCARGRGSVACGVAQRALLCAFMFVLMSFLYFRCILAFLYLCAAVYGVIKNNNNNSNRQLRVSVGSLESIDSRLPTLTQCKL